MENSDYRNYQSNGQTSGKNIGNSSIIDLNSPTIIKKTPNR